MKASSSSKDSDAQPEISASSERRRRKRRQTSDSSGIGGFTDVDAEIDENCQSSIDPMLGIQNRAYLSKPRFKSSKFIAEAIPGPISVLSSQSHVFLRSSAVVRYRSNESKRTHMHSTCRVLNCTQALRSRHASIHASLRLAVAKWLARWSEIYVVV